MARPAVESALAHDMSIPRPENPKPRLSDHARTLLAGIEDALSRRDARPGEAVLSFKDDAAYRRFFGRAHAAGLSIAGQIDALRTVRVRFENRRTLERELVDNAVDYAAAGGNTHLYLPQPIVRQERPSIDQVPFRNSTLGFLGAESTDHSGRGVVLAILDTGVAADATFGTRLRWLDIGLGTLPGVWENDGHGTAVAALAAGSHPDAAGVAPGATVLSLRVTDANGLSDLFTVSQAIVAATDAGAKIINLSLGGYSTGPALDRALAYARDRGAVVVAAAGNDQASQLAWPAADPRVVSVGAIDAAGQQVLFSNSGEQLQITAPGYGVQTAWLAGQRVLVNGTSASTPLVAGAIAAIMSQNPSLTSQQAAEVAISTASDSGPPGFDPAFGHGILNVGWAIHRNDPSYIDTAISSHAYDPATNEIQVAVQNRSGRSVSGMTMTVTAGADAVTRVIPSLAPGETHVVRVAADPLAPQSSGGLSIRSQLHNPAGVSDRVPENNQRSSIVVPAATPSR